MAPPHGSAIFQSAIFSDLRIAGCCWLLSNLIAFGAVGYSVNRLPTKDGDPPGRRTFVDSMLRWDGGWYKSVALNGYSHQRHQHSSVAFFPVYPLMALDVAMLTGLSVDVALLVVANFCFGVALMLLSANCRRRWPEAPERLRWGVALACSLFPGGCFFHMAYSESCFLLLSLAVFHSLERRWPTGVTAGIVGLATAARPTGIALLAPLAIHLWQGRSSTRSRLLTLALWLPVGCWGLIAYAVYQQIALGDALAFVDSQESCRMRSLVPGREKAIALVAFEPLRAVYDTDSPVCWRRFDRHWALSMQFANPVFFVAACALVALGFHKQWLSPAEGWFAALLLLIPYLTRGYEMGMGCTARFISVTFPVYFVLGRLLVQAPKWIVPIALAAMGFYLAAFCALFAAHHFVY
jgi:hypothetical protein